MGKIELKLFIGLSRTVNAINRASDKLFARFGLSRGQFAVLEALYHKGDLTVGRVQELILTTSGNIPVIVKNLEKRGLLTREQGRDDRRQFILSITESGRKLMAELYPQNETLIIKHMSLLSAAEQEELLLYLKKLGGRT